MRRRMFGLLFLALTPALAPGQTSDQPRGQGYAFFAPGGISGGGATTGTLHFGGGVEALFYKGLGVGGELGYLAPKRSFSNGIGILSLNGSYHFRNSKPPRKAVPFVTGGYSLGFRSGTQNLFNFGGGVNYWMRDHLGLRLEFRDHVNPRYGTAHYWEFRIGLAFR